jgi:3-hydroxybutyryl-CoA dehydrogenase
MRLMMPLINDAVALLAEGVASASDIDLAIKAGYGCTYGPLELADRWGIDDVIRTLQALVQETANPRFQPHGYLRKLARAGHMGIKSGTGFYHYDEWGERIVET